MANMQPRPSMASQGTLATVASLGASLSKATSSLFKRGSTTSSDTTVKPELQDSVGDTSVNVLEQTPAEAVGCRPRLEHDPFGDESGGGVHYKTLTWWQCSFLMIAETISLGILSLPAMIATMGFIPGVLLILFLGILATYTGYICGQVKQAHPSIHSFSEIARMLCGKPGMLIMDVCQALVFIFIMAAHILAFSIMMNVLTKHATCSIVFAAAGTILSLILTLPRTLKNVSWLSALSCFSVLTAVIITMIAVGIKQPNAYTAKLVVANDMTSWQAYGLGISNIVIAFTGHTAYFGFISELKHARDFPKSLALLQTIAITAYVVVAVVIYRYAGDTVASPALGSAPPMIRKIAYGVACPTVVVAGVVNAHVCVKNVYVRVWRGTDVMKTRGFRAVGSWVAMSVVVWLVAFLIACAIPVFSNLLGLIGALLCSWFSLGLPAIMWLWLNKDCLTRGWRKTSLAVLNVLIILICVVVCVMGTWGSVEAISKSSHERPPFSCADNA